MNAKQAQRLTKKINNTPGYRVTGERRYGHRDYALDVVITSTGDPLVINSPETWDDMLAHQAREEELYRNADFYPEED